MWFKSRAQHSDPAVRRGYIESLPNDHADVIAAAGEDPHPEVRGVAITRLTEMALLQQLAGADPDEQVRARASARLHTVVAGHAGAGPDLNRRKSLVQDSADLALLKYVARAGQEIELRQTALEQLHGYAEREQVEEVLCDIAVSDSIAELRMLAAEGVHSDTALVALTHNSKGRDKSVYRLAQQRLEKIRAVQKAHLDAARCCEDAQLVRAQFGHDELAATEMRLAALQADWTHCAGILAEAGELDPEQQSSFESDMQAVRQEIATQRDIRRARQEILEQLRSTLDGETKADVSELSRQWRELGEASAAETQRFDASVRSIKEQQHLRERDRQRQDAALQLIQQAEAIDADQQLTAAALSSLQERWKATPMPQDEALRTGLQERMRRALDRLQSHYGQQQASSSELLDKATVHIARYHAALEAGRLKEAVSAHDKASSLLDRCSSAELQARCDKLRERLQSGEARLKELQRWRHWGTQQAREQLCEQAESLAGVATEPPLLARQVRELREKWKKLDKNDGAAGKTLWERFDTACEKAYAPCQAYFDKQKQDRAANLEQRTRLCQQLERLASDTDWDNPPWREVADTLRTVQNQWLKSGPVDRRRQKKINERFRKAQAEIESRLAPQRDSERRRREALIEKIEAITPETRNSINQVRQAQRDWKPVVQCDRRTERKLWQRFRAACDAVFESHREQASKADQERQQHLAEKRAVIDQLQELKQQLASADSASGPERLASAMEVRKKTQQLRSGWKRIGPAPRAEQPVVEKQFRSVCNEIDQLVGQAEQAAKQHRLQELHDIGRRLDQIEHTLIAEAGGQHQEFEAELAALRDREDLDSLAERIGRIAAAVSGDPEATDAIRRCLVENLARKQQLCLELEIAANIDSPEEHRQERMAYRVNQLSASLNGQRGAADVETLQKSWYATGAVPPENEQQLAARFRRAVEAIVGRERHGN